MSPDTQPSSSVDTSEFRSMELTEDQLKDLSSVAALMFGDTNDPRSPAYVRKLERPKLRPFRMALFSLVPIIACVLITVGLTQLSLPVGGSIAIACGIFAIYCAVIARRAAICLVRVYQRFAPDKVRNSCRFEPSCSVYMIRAIEKYGLIRGVRKGIHRLRRCNVHDGGYDEP